MQSLTKITLVCLFTAFLGIAPWTGWADDETYQSRPEWADHFEFNNTRFSGTIVVVDTRKPTPAHWVSNEKRATQRFSPASTFKIPHTLIALDAGVVKDEFEVIKWDGVERSYAPWNQDQTLRTAMRNSTVWVYEEFAQAIGNEKEQRYLEKLKYGNQSAAGKAPFWIDGELAISAAEQIAFLQKLYANALPFTEVHQRLVKDLMIVEAGKDYIVRAKSGWNGSIGWWAGWVEHPKGPVFFALNIDTPNGAKDLPGREGIARSVLGSINALPAATLAP